MDFYNEADAEGIFASKDRIGRAPIRKTVTTLKECGDLSVHSDKVTVYNDDLTADSVCRINTFGDERTLRALGLEPNVQKSAYPCLSGFDTVYFNGTPVSIDNSVEPVSAVDTRRLVAPSVRIFDNTLGGVVTKSLRIMYGKNKTLFDSNAYRTSIEGDILKYKGNSSLTTRLKYEHYYAISVVQLYGRWYDYYGRVRSGTYNFYLLDTEILGFEWRDGYNYPGYAYSDKNDNTERTYYTEFFLDAPQINVGRRTSGSIEDFYEHAKPFVNAVIYNIEKIKKGC